MTNRISSDELLHLFEGFPAQTARRGSVAIGRLLASGGRHDQGRTIALLEFTAELAGRPSWPGGMPDDERSLWASVGARFDRRARGKTAKVATEAYADLLARSLQGDEEAARILRVNRSRISQRVAERSLYAYDGGDERCFPLWQFSDDRSVPGLRTVLRVLDDRLHPLVVDHFFTQPHVDLEIGGRATSPAVWLATGGDPEAVADLAADL
jgi:hypothetical protein